MTTWLRQYRDLSLMQVRQFRGEIAFVMMVQIVLSLGLVLGIGYIMPGIDETTATYLTTGTATQTFVTAGLVMLPQFLSEAKEDGRLDYMMTLPISREAYLLSQVTVVALLALPGVVFAVALGAWNYGITLSINPAIALVIVLSVFSLAGVGVAMAILSPYRQVTNALTQLIIFYVLFFAPVLVPKSQLPWLLRKTAVVMPPTYAADGTRATLTKLPGTDLAQDLLVMTGFAVLSFALSAMMIRRRQ